MDPFHAVRAGDANAFREAISRTTINARDEFGTGFLHYAIAYGHTALGIELIERGIDCNAQDTDGATPLHYAADYRNEMLAKRILDAGGRFDIPDQHGNQPLWTAAFNARGDYRIVNLFIERGADAFHKNKHGKSPADMAKTFQDDGLVRSLKLNLSPTE